MLVVLFPQSQQQRFNAFFFFRVEGIAFRNVEWIEPDGFLFFVGEIIPAKKVTEPFVGTPYVNDEAMGALFKVTAHEVVHAYRFP